jgi:hypothetical protein
MANNYTQFSFAIPFPKVLPPKEEEEELWANTGLELPEPTGLPLTTEEARVFVEAFCEEWEKEKELVIEAGTSGLKFWETSENSGEEMFNVEVDVMEEDIWVHSEESGSPEAAAYFVQHYLSYFGMEGGVFFTWAETCSKPRINEFNGGGCVVTKDNISWSIPQQHLLDSDLGIEILNL